MVEWDRILTTEGDHPERLRSAPGGSDGPKGQRQDRSDRAADRAGAEPGPRTSPTVDGRRRLVKVFDKPNLAASTPPRRTSLRMSRSPRRPVSRPRTATRSRPCSSGDGSPMKPWRGLSGGSTSTGRHPTGQSRGTISPGSGASSSASSGAATRHSLPPGATTARTRTNTPTTIS